MKRDPRELAERDFDVLVVGGGIYGAWAVWDATLRGLSAALIERGDFGGGTSSNNFKLVHGGLRYLQHLDLKRMRESIREQRALRRVAPHLVHPMPCLVPTYGAGLKGRTAMRAGLLLNDWISYDRNRGVLDSQHLVSGRILSATEVKERIPGAPTQGLTGGAMWSDAQMRSPDRLLLSVVRSAAARGAVVSNYVEATGLRREGDRIAGVEARDVLTDDALTIRAKVTLNTAGPAVDRLLSTLDVDLPELCPATQAWNLVLRRQLFGGVTAGLYSTRHFGDADRRVSRGGRLIFFQPWRGRTLVGTSHAPLPEGRLAPDLRHDRDAMLDLLAEAADAYPAADLSEDDIAFAHCGVLPGTLDPGSGDVRLLKQYVLRDHAAEDRLPGLLTCVGVKFTTARDVAEKMLDLAMHQLGREAKRSLTSETPIFGGDFQDFDALRRASAERLPQLSADARVALVENHGAGISEVFELGREDPAQLEPLAGTSVLRGEVTQAIRREMAVRLEDVVRRRTELGSAGLASGPAVEEAARIMGRELGWSEEERIRQVRAVLDLYASFEPHPALDPGSS